MAEGALISAIRIGLASPEAIRRQSFGEVTRSELFDPHSGHPIEGGLFCERIFGPSSGGACPRGEGHRWARPEVLRQALAICSACGKRLTAEWARRERRVRLGHIELAVPICHPWFVHGRRSAIGLLLNLPRGELDRLLEDGAGTILDRLRAIDLEALGARLRDEERWSRGKPGQPVGASDRLRLVEAMRRANQQPEWLVLSVLPVLPADLRPPRQRSVDDSVQPDLNRHYVRLIERNRRLRELLEGGAPEEVVRAGERQLRASVDSLVKLLASRLTGLVQRVAQARQAERNRIVGPPATAPVPFERDATTAELTLEVSPDVVLGCYYLTLQRPGGRGEGRVFADADEACLCQELRLIDLQTLIRVRLPGSGSEWAATEAGPSPATEHELQLVETTAGRLILQQAIEESLRRIGEPPLRLINKQIDKDGLRQIVALIERQRGRPAATAVLEAFNWVGQRFANRSGISLAIGDFPTPPERPAMIAAAEQEDRRCLDHHERGLTTDEERFVERVALWTRAKEEVSDAMQRALDWTGPLATIVGSGAGRGIQEIIQICGMRGAVHGPDGKICELPIQSNLRDGLAPLEFVLSAYAMWHTRGGRRQRRAGAQRLLSPLLGVAQRITVDEEDCGTQSGIWVKQLAWRSQSGSQYANPEQLQRLLGRCSVEAVLDPADSSVLVAEGACIGEAERERLEAAGIERIMVRSPINCESQRGVCQRCYGWDPAQHAPVRIGAWVGLGAAQSMASPASELPSRRLGEGISRALLHDPDQLWGLAGVARLEELFEARRPRQAVIFSQVQGTVTLESATVPGSAQVIRVLGDRYTRRSEYSLEAGCQLLVHQGQHIRQGQCLAVDRFGAPRAHADLTGMVELVVAPSPFFFATGTGRIVLATEEQPVTAFRVPSGSAIAVEHGQRVNIGDQLTDSPNDQKDPAEVLEIFGRDRAARYLVDAVWSEFRNGGYRLEDRQIELIVRQMLRFVRIADPGDAAWLAGELVDRSVFDLELERIQAAGGRGATARPVVLGVNEAARQVEGFLATAAGGGNVRQIFAQAALAGATGQLLRDFSR